MKTNRTLQKLTAIFTSTTLLSMACLTVNAESNRGGTDILHFSVKEAMTQPEVPVLPDASGRLALMYKGQGHVVVQNLDITVKKLAPNTDYTLAELEFRTIPLPPDAELGAQAEEVLVAMEPALDEFTSDKKGNASLRYRRIVHENGQAQDPGKGKRALPAGLDLLEEVMLGVVDADGKIVLVADLSAPDKFSYLVKRDLSTVDVRATLRIAASPSAARLTLLASPLDPSTEYTLALNDSTEEVFTTDAKGRLVVRSVFENPRDILKLESLEVLDMRPTFLTPPEDPIVVLSTDLPLPDK